MKYSNKLLKKLIMGTFGSAAFALPALSSAAVPGYMDFLPAWTQAANACALDEASLNEAQITNSGFYFRSGSTKTTVSAWCNVTNPLDVGNPDGVGGRPNWNGLIAGYQDPDGRGANANVSARLYRLNRTTGGSTLVAQFDSNQWINNSAWQEGLKSIPTTAKFDFKSYEYYVLVTLSRVNTSVNPYLSSLRIAPVAEVPQ